VRFLGRVWRPFPPGSPQGPAPAVKERQRPRRPSGGWSRAMAGDPPGSGRASINDVGVQCEARPSER